LLPYQFLQLSGLTSGDRGGERKMTRESKGADFFDSMHCSICRNQCDAEPGILA